MRILITGAGGQLGTDLGEMLAAFELHPLGHGALDVSDENAVNDAVRGIKPRWIINAAAYNDVDGAEQDAERAFAVNGAGPGFLADAAGLVGASLIHISTDYVFDGTKGSPYVEEDRPNPLSVYGRSKLEGERRVLNSTAASSVLRTAWLYGVHGKNFVKAIQKAARKGGPLRVVADQVGSPTWTWHLAGAIRNLIASEARGLFHVVNAGHCSRFEFAQAIVQGSVEVLPISSAEAARPAPRPANSALSSRRWPAANLPPLPDWRSALDEYLRLSEQG